ncbi:PREDICTED: uncharacterized protein LOC105116866 isoform X2 [Populus euphratica]|uniref:Uncharacterized protein LOC105116866 isoform X2 n=1 Tax=Populus euphratica TaxID=75702 RepID=A0AAJ6TK38_POPEU|nr:PREDICTED: uncharacterized protein LOC105116866 isoform X2 [Populus euphratica]
MSINFFCHWWSIQDSFGVVSNFPFQSLSSYIKLELICQSFNLFLWPWEFWNRLVWIRAPGAGVFVGERPSTAGQRPSSAQRNRCAGSLSSFHESEQLTKKQQTSLSTPAEVYKNPLINLGNQQNNGC